MFLQILYLYRIVFAFRWQQYTAVAFEQLVSSRTKYIDDKTVVVTIIMLLHGFCQRGYSEYGAQTIFTRTYPLNIARDTNPRVLNIM